LLVVCRAGEEELPAVVECVVEGRTRTPHYRLLNRPEISIFPEGAEPQDEAFFPEPECILGESSEAHAHKSEPIAHAPEKKSVPALVTLRGLRMQRRIYECQYCSLDFPALDLVVEHIARAHPVGLNCPVCNEKFCGADALEQHRKDKHWRVQPHQQEPQQQQQEEQGDESDDSDESKMDAFTRLPDGFQCNECNVIFPREQSYQQHICYPATSNRCKRCKLSFGTHLALVRHISMVHGNPNAQKSKFNCNVCGAKFAHEVSFQRHLQAHITAA
jgi:Zinc-finger of C2H2 type/C2H2-type zinc finger